MNMNQVFNKSQMILMMKTTVSNNRILQLNNKDNCTITTLTLQILSTINIISTVVYWLYYAD